jgi:nicotinate-nucleotide pyrophosphorylase (carboxylating)
MIEIENNPLVKEIISLALKEDLGPGDITTDAVIKEKKRAKAKLIAKEEFILAGLPVFKAVFRQLSKDVVFEDLFKEGDLVRYGQVICYVDGPVSVILKAERTALNFLQRMSGIATAVRNFVKKVSHTKVKILDTRKTAPGMRLLDKYAVRIGGGSNHRLGLFDGILIKDNHISAIGSIKEAIQRAKSYAPHTLKIEVEVENLSQLREAIDSGADIVLLDNMGIEEIKKAVEIAKGKVLIEVSGGIKLSNIETIAATGVDFISVGEITHSVKGVDISLELQR